MGKVENAAIYGRKAGEIIRYIFGKANHLLLILSLFAPENLFLLTLA